MQKSTAYLLLVLLITASISTFAQSDEKFVLIEQFTNTTCPTCGNLNPQFASSILEVYDEVIHIAYHNDTPLTFDPFYLANTEEALIRDEYYNVSASPTAIINGTTVSPGNPLIPISALSPELGQTSELGFEISQSSGDVSRSVNVEVSSFENLPSGDYKLHVLAIEKNIVFCTYFEYYFENVFRTYLTDAEGQSFSAPSVGDSDTYSFTLNMDSAWQNEKIAIVAFVQDDTDKRVINAGESDITSTASYERIFIEDTLHMGATIESDLCGDGNGSIVLNMCIDTAPIEDPLPDDYNYSWTNGSTTKDIYNLIPGIYTVNISQNRVGMNYQFTFEVTGPSSPITTTINSTPENNTDQDGTIEIIASGGTGNLSIFWDNGSTSFVQDDLSSGTYSATIVDQNGCSEMITVTVGSNITAISITAEVESVSCNGSEDGSIDVTISGGVPPYSSSWNNGENMLDLEDLGPGVYTLTITDSSGQSSSLNFTIIEPPAITISGTVTPEFESTMNGSIELNVNGGSGGYTIQWSNGDTGQIVEDLSTGSYTVSVMDSNGCFAVEEFFVDMVEEGGVTVITNDASCNGSSDGSVSMMPFGDISVVNYVWFSGQNTGSNLTGLSAGNYDFIAIDDNGNVVYSGNFVIGEPNVIDLVTDQSNGFEDGFAAVTSILGGTPPYEYSWNTGSTEPMIDDIEDGSYVVTITDTNGCTNSSTVTIASNTFNVNDNLCNGGSNGSIDLIINDGNQYDIDWGNGQTGLSATGLAAGPYNVLIEDIAGDVFSFILEVDEPTAIEIDAIVQDDMGAGGSIITNAGGGTPPYEWLWEDGSTATSIIDLGPGEYQVFITDALGCSETAVYEIITIVGFNNLENQSIQVYPNPVSDHFNVVSQIEIQSASIFDLTGAHICDAYSENSKFSLGGCSLSTGIYLLLLEDTNNEVHLKKLVVAKD